MPVGQFSILLIETLSSDASTFKKLSTADILKTHFNKSSPFKKPPHEQCPVGQDLLLSIVLSKSTQWGAITTRWQYLSQIIS